MNVKHVIDEDFVNYKEAAMLVAFTKCKWKCAGCQNKALGEYQTIQIDPRQLVKRYMINPITSALVCGGLEPMDTFTDLYNLVFEFREKTDDPIIIYTGYTADELESELFKLKMFNNIIVKFGRYLPDLGSTFSPLLGVTLASKNQYAEKIS
jgi:pyruvate-formate lyase-activating enzyme